MEPGVERVQALTDILHSTLFYDSNESCALIANPTNNAQLRGTPSLLFPNLHPGLVVWECGEGQTDTHTYGHDHYTFDLGYASRKM